MSSRRLLTLPVCLAALAAVPTVADAASTPKYPTISKITPMRATIGETMTITGRGFIRGQRKNIVVFKRDGKPALFLKADTATPTRLTLILPEKLREFLGKRENTFVPTRFRIRISARRFGKSYTTLANSPVITATASAAGVTPTDANTGTAPVVTLTGAAAAGAASGPATSGGTGTTTGGGDPAPVADPDCDGDGLLDINDSDDDGDLLSDVLEVALNTNRCAKDTDGDGMEDGWEWKSAYDLNQESCRPAEYPTPCPQAIPYPGKRPYPNPLDGSDPDYDYDGDSLPAWAEHKASLRHGRTINALWYSDGLQASVDTSTSPTCRGMAVPAPYGNEPDYSLDVLPKLPKLPDGCLNDAERDEDGDYLSNFTELRGSLSGPEVFKSDWKEPLYPLNYAGTDWLDADSDGDTRPDGVDDQDNDDFWNIEEAYRGAQTVDKEDIDSLRRDGLWTNPFNPCLPSPNSRTCGNIIANGGAVYRPFVGIDAKRADWPKPRWPLYGAAFFNGENDLVTTPEIWNGISEADQETLPPMHPLVPRPGF